VLHFLASAERPVILAGAGVLRARCSNDLVKFAELLHVPVIASTSEARYAESVESGHSNQSEAALIAQALGITSEPLRLDSQTKYAVVARGDASIYLRLPHGDYRENVWDHAAGSLIVAEAGGRVSDASGRPLDFTRGRRLDANRGIVASAASIHERGLGARAARLE